MTKKCFVSMCKSGYKTCKEKVSLFRAPNNEELLKQWRDAIAREDREMSRKDHVCEKHFAEEDIIRYWVYQDIKDKLSVPRLKKTAVPSIFPDKCSPTEVVKVKRKKKAAKTPKSAKTPKAAKTRKSAKTEKPEIGILESDGNTTLYIVTETYETADVLEKSNIFYKLWNNEMVLTVPSSSWALHKVESTTSKIIIVSDVEVTNNVPCYQKQIVMNDDDTVSIIIGTSIISQEDQIKYFGNPVRLDCLEDLNMLIYTLHTLNLAIESVNSDSGYCEVLN